MKNYKILPILSDRRLFYRPKDFKRVGFFSRVCIDIEGAPELPSLLVGRVKIDANIRRLVFGEHDLLEFCGKAFTRRIDRVDDELPVACIRINKVEGITRIILTELEVTDGVVEHDARFCRIFRTFPRTSEEKAEKNDKQDGYKASGMIHHNVQILYCV